MSKSRRRWAGTLILGVVILTYTSWGLGQADPHAQHANHVSGGGSFFSDLLKVYTPRRVCMFYEAPVIWLHIVGDLVTALAYYGVAIGLGYFIRRRTDMAFSWIFWLFAAFILACGTTHLIGVIDIWRPFYKVDGLVKVLTAVLSLGTAIAMWPLIPRALAIPGPAQLSATIEQRTAELRAALKAAEQARAAAEEANKAKDHFLAVLSHELRTPLTPVLAGVSMLQERHEEESEMRDHLEMIRRNVEMEARLIDDLLDVTRITQGKIELDRRQAELGAIIHRTVEVCLPDIEARKQQLDLELGAQLYFVHADVARLQQVLWNIIKNAVKFTPQGGRVSISCRRQGDHVVVEVNDNGVGIEPEAMSRLFQPFEQGERGTTRQFGGLGLGLTISKQLVEMHGGSISAESAGKNQGATFRVTLPLSNKPVSPAADQPAESERTHAQRDKLRILLVEDHADTARIMRHVLAAKGHHVLNAVDIATAVKLAATEQFDLLISDLGLPDGSGWDLMQQIRATRGPIPAIAISGYGMSADVHKSIEAGFAEHLTKPVDINALFAAIARVTQGRS